MEEVAGSTAKERENNIGIVTGVDLVRDAQAAGCVFAQLAEVVIEAAVLLHHHDDVFQGLKIAASAGDADGCGCGGGVAGRIRGRDGIGGVRGW